jgi:KUP system potassium uptake protein
MSEEHGGGHSDHHKLSAAGLLITLGIIYGDIGTSPLYVMRSIVGDRTIQPDIIFGAVSLVFWTLTIQTTFKYIFLVLQADNNGEGGIFSLYTLVRRRAKWLLFPAMIGGCSMLAEGIITPPISVTAAIEGLEAKFEHIPTVGISIVIISLLFFFQRFGTAAVGKAFGPIMFVWFSMLGILGISQIVQNPGIFVALNPMYGIKLLIADPQWLVILGAVFLCTTGAEALYADLGHCGKKNIRLSWIFVKSMLILNYMGQGVWCLKHTGEQLSVNPFYGVMPEWFLLTGVAIAAMAAIIASQAMISGSFTLASEAIRLNLFPKLTMVFPSHLKGQLYVPAVNNFLWVGCILVTLYFQESHKMEAAYGLSVTLTMLMSTILLSNFLVTKRVPKLVVLLFLCWYLLFEGTFFAANLLKFVDGGYITIIMASILFAIMFTVIKAKEIKNRFVQNVPITNFLDQLITLSNDESIPKYASNLVYLSNAKSDKKVEEKILYSILQTQPKRADIYWFVSVEVTDEPYTMQYKVNTIAKDDVYKINFKLGFRVEQRMNLFVRKVIEDLIESDEANVLSRYHTSRSDVLTGDIKFVIINEFLSNENELPVWEQLVMNAYLNLKKITASPKSWFGLDSDSVEEEYAPIVLRPVKDVKLTRIK